MNDMLLQLIARRVGWILFIVSIPYIAFIVLMLSVFLGVASYEP